MEATKILKMLLCKYGSIQKLAIELKCSDVAISFWINKKRIPCAVSCAKIEGLALRDGLIK